MSHNSENQEIDFFLSFLNHAINGDARYKSIIISLLQDAKSLAIGKSIYEIDKTSLKLKIQIDRFAHEWLLSVDVAHPSVVELRQLQEIINEHKNYAFA